ncbi:MAG TPA: 50S ribosomal protein L25 [Bacilli bacterium]
MSVRLNTLERTDSTKQMRKNGKIPGVIYGKGHESSSIAIDEKELMGLLNSTPHAVFTMNVPHQGIRSVMISEVQRHKVNRNLLHVDFHQINMNEPIQTLVRLDPKGESAGEKSGGILLTNLHEIAIKCMPNKIPTGIEYDISSLEIGESLFVRDLEIPEGIELKSDPDDVIAAVKAPNREEEVVEEDTANAETSEAQAEAAENPSDGK